MDLSTFSGITELLWTGGLAATPVALAVGAICRVKSLRPATRHMLWATVLVSFVTPAIGMMIWRPDWFHSQRVLAAADKVLESAESILPTSSESRGPGPAVAGRVAGAERAPAVLNQPAKTPAADASSAGDARVDASLNTPRRAVRSTEPNRAVEPAIEARPTPEAGSVSEAGRHERTRNRTPRPDAAPSVPSDRLTSEHDRADLRARDHGLVAPPIAPAPSLDAERSPIAAAVEPAVSPASERLGADVETLNLDLTGLTSMVLGFASKPEQLEERPATPPKGSGPALSEKSLAGEVMAPPARPGLHGSASSEDSRVLAGARDQIRPWISRALDVRDSISSLPPVPALVWASVTALLLLISLVRTARVGWWLRGGRPADDQVMEIVDQVASDLGLRRVPSVVMVNRAVSPMIWCGPRLRLVLPADLWESLDVASRRAVVTHELAHLRRLDHVYCWVESIVGAVYWWHPAAWWARWRLRDAAEASCDAWVTALLPSDRRAYATALVTTKSFLNSHEPSAGPCLGIMSGSAKRLARRITMVMTQRTAPRTSIVGACLAVIVMAAGMFVTPSLACPPEGEQKAKAAEKKKEKAAKSKRAEAGSVFYGEAPALEAMVAQPSPPNVVVVRPGGAAQFGGTAVAPMAPKAPKPPKPPKAPKPPRAAHPAHPAHPPQPPEPPQPGLPSAEAPSAWTTVPGVQGQWTQPVDLEALKEGRVAKTYKLSEGKLESFYSLMSRSDVPVLVSMEDEGIVIWAREEEHPFIASFIKLIDSGASSAGGQHSMTTLPGHAIALEQYAAAQQAHGAHAAAQEARAAFAAGHKAHAEALRQHAQSLKALLKDRDVLMLDVDRMRADADSARDRAEQLRDLEMDLREKAESASEHEAKAALEAAHARLRERASALDRESGDMQRRVEELEQRIEELEARAEELEDEISMLEDDGFGMLDEIQLANIDLAEPVDLADIDLAGVVEVDLADIAPIAEEADQPSPAESPNESTDNSDDNC